MGSSSSFLPFSLLLPSFVLLLLLQILPSFRPPPPPPYSRTLFKNQKSAISLNHLLNNIQLLHYLSQYSSLFIHVLISPYSNSFSLSVIFFFKFSILPLHFS